MNIKQKDHRPVCFVVMGFGKKTDFESGRTLDLDATYEAIIRPTVVSAGLRCIRADEVMHSGIIDTEMYNLLLRAELVIADISTGNLNAVYELGVRHALRPNSTIVMIEQEGKLRFDLNHTSTFRYEHMGKDIGSREAVRAKADLQALVVEVMKSKNPDSPVYTYLPKLKGPRLTDNQFETLLEDVEAVEERLSDALHAGVRARAESRHADAASHFSLADRIKPNDPYVLQQLALSTYQAESPSPVEALVSARQIIERLSPSQSNDPETLGIAGAISKRLWLGTQSCLYLDQAIGFYQRGFVIRGDYYNGENLAICFGYRAAMQTDENEKWFDLMSAAKVRTTVVNALEEAQRMSDFNERSDRKWIFASLANCLAALGRFEDSERNEKLFFDSNPSAWEIESYEHGRGAVVAEAITLKPSVFGALAPTV
ncbi:DUF4071 domain-containing protein [Pararobbsia alpina]|uniref:tetratricopeptide repeat-containing protein n=1 Tax=Pararobbsia alpina TaxID=621374 RepID=UPI0039A463E3